MRNRVGAWGVIAAALLCGCDRPPISGDGNAGGEPTPAPSIPPAMAERVPPGDRIVFFDGFEDPQVPQWEPMVGDWDVSARGDGLGGYTAVSRGYALTYAGSPNWSNYRVSAQVTIDDDRQGQVGIVGRGDTDHYYFELVLGRNPKGERTWALRERLQHRWNTLASGPFEYTLGTPYVLQLSFREQVVEAAVSINRGRWFTTLGGAKLDAERWPVGRAGLVTYGGLARFDDLVVSGPEIIALVDVANGWGPVRLLRDNTNTFTNGKPGGGWFVTPIHVNLRPDGKVLVTGFSRKAASGCSNGAGGTQRQNGMTWLLNPSDLDPPDPDDPDATDMTTLLTQPINEQNLDTARDVLYCAGHSTMADGRVFFTAGTRYVDILPDSSPERGLRYSRIFSGNSIIRVANNSNTYHMMSGGQSASYPAPGGSNDGGTVRGEKWYPTTLLMPDGKLLIFGGFHWSGGGPGSKANNSFETFDPAVWDANHNTNPYSVLMQHTTSFPAGDLPPTRGYSNMFLLPKPVPAGNANGWARSVAIFGGRGRVVLFNHEPGPSGIARVFARPNALTPSPDSGSFPNERAEGGSGVLLADGRIMIANGGHTGAGSSKVYFYNPYADNWTSPAPLETGISRMYGQAVQLPDGKVMIMDGYNGNPGGNGQPDPEPGNTSDISNPVGDTRRPVLVDPYASPITAATQPAWPEITHRGYHSVALLLKDGRILVGGGKDGTHATGCEKNELRIYTPPYLLNNPTRPLITNVPGGGTGEFQVQVGSGTFTINYTGTLKSTRGVALVALGSLTHAFDMGQRYVPLTAVSGGGASGSVTVQAPTNINIAQPGYYNLFVINSAGVPSVGATFRLLPPPTCVFNVDGNASSYLEAESPSRRDGPWITQSGPVSGGTYLEVNSTSGSHTSAPDEGKVLWFDVNVTSGGTFIPWLHANGPNTSADSFWVSINGSPDVQINLPANSWGWVKPATATLNIPTGKHTLKVKVREQGALLDKIVLTKSTSFTPSGITNAVLTCNGVVTAPNAPSTLVANDGVGVATLSWTDNSNNESSFRIERKLQGQPDTSYAEIAMVGANMTMYTDSPAAGSYTYRVRAHNAGGFSGYSNADDAVVSPVPPPAAPSDLVASDGVGQATLSWVDNSDDETQFKIERKLEVDPDTSFTQIATVGANVTMYTDNPAAASYTYRVRASNAAGDSGYSNSDDAVVSPPPSPNPPSNLNAAIGAGGTTVNLSWQDNSTNETGFRVERKLGTGSYSTLATKAANTTTHADATATATATYTYRVIATGTADSAPSNEVVVVIRNPAADAHVRDGTHVDNNYGANTTIEAKNNPDVGNNRQVFVRFTLADVAPTVSSARLRIHGLASTAAKTIAISAVADTSWVEGTGTVAAPVAGSGVDWNSKPAIGSQLTTLSVGVTAQYWEIDITSYVQAQKTAGATAVSLAITQVTSSTNSPTSFNSKENASNKPMLVISSK
jgi:Domain of unknown function (DUF1929)